MTDTTHHSDDFANAFEAAFERLQARLRMACAGEVDWPDQMAAGIRAVLDFATADPAAAETLTSAAISRGNDGLDSYERIVSHFEEYLRAGRDLHPDGTILPEFTERALVGGVTMLIAQRLDAGRVTDLTSTAREATQFVLTPYIGAEEARRAATRPGA